MSDAVTDTHGLIWHLADDRRLGLEAHKLFAACERGEIFIYVPTICLVEIIYLQERGRIPADMKDRFEASLQSGRTGLIVIDLTPEVVNALSNIPRADVPDMPDRIIAATAAWLNLPLISRDHFVQSPAVKSIW